MENDAQILETLVVKEDEPTSPESYNCLIPQWGEMHEKLEKEKMYSQGRGVYYTVV